MTKNSDNFKKGPFDITLDKDAKVDFSDAARSMLIFGDELTVEFGGKKHRFKKEVESAPDSEGSVSMGFRAVGDVELYDVSLVKIGGEPIKGENNNE